MKSDIRIELGDLTVHNIGQLRKVNQVVFPVSYNAKFYSDIVRAGDLAKLSFFNDIVVGGVCCRVDASNDKKRLYIMTLGCLAPYRRYGLGSLMLKHVLSIARRNPLITSIFLHVQVNNESALSFYRKFGFDVAETSKNYYKRIEPADAYVLEKRIRDERGELIGPSDVDADVPADGDDEHDDLPEVLCEDNMHVLVNGK